MDLMASELDIPMAKVRSKNLHNVVKCQMVDAGVYVAGLRLPENGKPNRMAWVSSTYFSTSQNGPVAFAIRRCNGESTGTVQCPRNS